MEDTKTYTCLCGATFSKPQQFNGHKQGCEVHLINKYGSMETYYEIKNRNHNRGKTVKARAQEKHKVELEQWIHEHHTCEKCGKVMTQKYGYGRFCSQSCANGRPKSTEERARIRKSTKATYMEKDIRGHNIIEYNKQPNTCTICGAQLTYDQRERKTCSKNCEKEYHRRFRNDYIAEFGPTGCVSFCKYGTYNGIHCDSSWELAFLVYCLEHDISIRRNTELFEYTYDGSVHRYFPDFIVDTEYYEIKGYYDDVVHTKCEQFPKDKVLHMIDSTNISTYLDYAESKYGKNFCETLYDRSSPSYLDKLK